MTDDIATEEQYDYPEDFKDSKWHGVPPAGEKPAPPAWRYMLEITIVLMIEFLLWGIYRWATADFYGQFGSYWFFVGHIIAAPLIHLGPILVYWVFIRKERIFSTSERENGQDMSFSLGPFKMTRKFLFTAVLVGLFGGIVWRFTEMAVSDATGVMLGGYDAGTFWIYDLFTGSDFWLFLLMTFVMFFIVGPVEEFEFRSFVHDQSQRVLPKWGALVYSSVFFGFSHIPIAITVYDLSFVELIFAEISWMTAGAVFGALYMWSRNIFACIVMHGIGNWQLSVFVWRSRVAGGGLDSTESLIVSLVTSIVANAVLIVLFYLVHRYYWEPQRNGKAAFGGKLLALQTRFFKHDKGSRSIGKTSGWLFSVTVGVLVVLVLGTMAAGIQVDDEPDRATGDSETDFDLTEYQETTETFSNSKDLLEEGNTDTYPFESTENKILIGVNVRLTWEDETEKPGRPTLRRYTNQPDTMKLNISGPNVTANQEKENPQGQEGSIDLEIDISQEVYTALSGKYSVEVSVTMVQAGIWTGMSLFGFSDPGNGYDIQVELTYLQSPDNSGEDDEVPEEDE